MAKKQRQSMIRHDTAAKNISNAKSKPKREVQVITCPSAFPISTKVSKQQQQQRKRPHNKNNYEDDYDDDNDRMHNNNNNNNNNERTKLLDWNETTKEIRAYGARGFIGKQKKEYEDETYYKLTGRHKKKPKTPLPLVRGLKRAAMKRDEKARIEAQKAGVVIPKKQQSSSANTKSMSDADFEKYGPAPNIGFMKSGVYRVQRSSNNGRPNNNKRKQHR